MWSDARRFWGKTAWRSAGLAGCCALVLALVTINMHLLRSSLWFTPPGVASDSRFVTLGAYSPEGRFSLASRADLRALDHLGFSKRYVFYSEDLSALEFAGRTWRNQPVAFVSDGFFGLLDVQMALGVPFGADRSGVVLDYEFWKNELGSPSEIAGRTVQVGGSSLPILGVTGKQFHGLGARHPAVWLPDKLRSRFLEISVQGADAASVAALKEVMAEHMPAYHALVALQDPAEASLLDKWKVETSTIAASSGGSSSVSVSFNRSDFRPAILSGIDVAPEETAAIARHLWLLSSLSVVLLLLAMLTLAAYWGARTTERGQEIQARRAMGAHISDLLHLFANEAAVFLGAVILLSLPIAYLQSKMLHEIEPFRSFLLNRYAGLGVGDFAPTLLIVAVIGLAALFAPLLNVMRSPMVKHSLGAGTGVALIRSAMAGVQWTLVIGVALLAGASLLATHRMNTVSWGGQGNPLLVNLPAVEKQRVLDALHMDARSMAAIDTPPLTPLLTKNDSFVPGLNRDGHRITVYENRWTPAAFAELGVPVIAGRLYDPGSESQIAVSESYAQAMHMDPAALLNKQLVRIDMNGNEMPSRTIVGVVGDVHYDSLQTLPELVAYVPPPAGNEGFTLLLPQSERDRVQGTLSILGAQNMEMASLSQQVTSMAEMRANRARTERLLSLATLAYSLLALALLMLGMVSDAQMQMQHRSRELALVVSLGARLNQAVAGFIKAPLLVMAPSVALVLVVAFLARVRWLNSFPLLGKADFGNICALALSVVIVFVLSLLIFGVKRLRELSLAELLRVER